MKTIITTLPAGNGWLKVLINGVAVATVPTEPAVNKAVAKLGGKL